MSTQSQSLRCGGLSFGLGSKPRLPQPHICLGRVGQAGLCSLNTICGHIRRISCNTCFWGRFRGHTALRGRGARGWSFGQGGSPTHPLGSMFPSPFRPGATAPGRGHQCRCISHQGCFLSFFEGFFLLKVGYKKLRPPSYGSYDSSLQPLWSLFKRVTAPGRPAAHSGRQRAQSKSNSTFYVYPRSNGGKIQGVRQ